MLKRQIEDVRFSAEEVGKAFANSSDKTQRDFLLSMLDAVIQMDEISGSWCLQCHAIVNGTGGRGGLSDVERSCIASMLNTLLDHLNEPANVTN